MEEEHPIPIWFFIGALVGVYGVIILATGLYHCVHPPEIKVALYEYHADVWWGALMTVMGLFYCVRFRPNRQAR